MTRIIAIAAGGAIGAVLRFWVSTGIYALLGREFPYGTLVVNVLGSLLMGFLYIFMLERITSIEWRAALLIGLLGAFTTFSTFSLETMTLIEGGEPIKALVNIFISVSLCLLATWLGIQLARLV
ncbi:camphor resistance protein CrcB [Candidatus Thiomargarita nelsonii]|uniref:Fluoride-specific ion channel FluC n=1 Tax=Candidatus Thiomargarita nelsonii TaxID=1003181 RepID=A0A0A6P9P9_9GAMM|nr:camphor resistance protein CrcB [Candidatus Thiomargarita nelsonii]